MIRLKIDDKEIEVQNGTSILAAASKAGIKIPTMCFHEEIEPFASCMICLVKDSLTGKLLPSCSVIAEDGMQIITGDEEVLEARRMALELLLSEHVGECQAPCQVTCPAHMDIPLMNRLLAQGKTNEALRVVLQDIPMPSVLGRICSAPCEGACRRKSVDEPVSICLLKRYAGDYGSLMDKPVKPNNHSTQQKIAIIGAGPAGLSAAYYLSISGYHCVLMDRNEKPGGMLRYGVPQENLPHNILNREIERILNSEIELNCNVSVDKKMFDEIISTYDAVIIATGNIDDNIRSWKINSGEKGIQVNKNNYQTSVPNVFAVGNVLRSSKMAVRSVGQGKEVAESLQQFLNGGTAKGYKKMFNSRFGRLLDEEIAEYLKESQNGKQIHPEEGSNKGFSLAEVKEEASRCLHCDCREMSSCKLRIYADQYEANQRRFLSDDRKQVTKILIHDSVIYEPGKCIKCGICVRLTAKYKEKYGFTFIGRGFDVQIGIPFNEDLRSSLEDTAERIAQACPTGALSIK